MFEALKRMFSTSESTPIDIDHPPKKPAKAGKNSTADKFIESVRSIGHPEYPILSKDYSPTSRIPCTDLIPFILDCIESDNVSAIKKVMRLVIEANPGVGVGSSWIEKSVDEILAVPFHKYVEFKTDRGLNELRACFIVASKTGGAGPFLVTEDIPKLVSQSLVCHAPQWKPEMKELIDNANAWIDKMATDTPYWEGYPHFDSDFMKASDLDESIVVTLQNLSPAARLQLFYAVETSGGSLPSLTSFGIRNMGINVAKTSSELTEHDLLTPSKSAESLASANTKSRLIELCQDHDVAFRKSWSKLKLAEAIASEGNGLIERISRESALVAPNFSLYSNLESVVDVSKQHQAGFELLCFAQ